MDKSKGAEGQKSPLAPRVAFISGHTDLPLDQFREHYHAKMHDALESGDHFVLGEAKGVDSMALQYLLSQSIVDKYPDIASRITVFASRPYNVPRLRAVGVAVVAPDDRRAVVQSPVAVVEKTGRDAARHRHIQRDAALTAASDYDILWFRDEAASRLFYGGRYRPRLSGTEMNSQRRMKGGGRKGPGEGSSTSMHGQSS